MCRAAPTALVLALLATAATGAAASAQLLPEPEQPPKAELATTGNKSELLRGVPISKRAGTRERVAMSLGPDELRRIDPGDRLRVSAEVQVSTTCVKAGARCFGSHYNINPRVIARVVLAGAPNARGPSLDLSQTVTQFCKQSRPNRNHHCTLAIPNSATTVSDLATLPCAPKDCHVNLIVSAYHRKAKPSNRIVLGADRPDGSVAGDKGRLNVVHARAETPAPVSLRSSELVNSSLPTTEGKNVRRRVVHSVPIQSPRQGEVLAFDGSFVVDITGLRYNTFIATRAIVAESPTATSPIDEVRSASILRGQATEGNGFNCTLGRSGYTSPCTVRKAGATRITKDIVDEISGPGILYLNLVAASKALLSERLKGPSLAALRAADGLQVLRYSR